MDKPKFLSTLLQGIKYGVVAVLANVAFLPLPIIIGDYFGRMDMVGHYSGPLPISWIIGLSIAIAIPFAMPFMLVGSALGMVIFLSHKANFLKKFHGALEGVLLGLLASVWGLGMFGSRQLEALGTWVFIGIMVTWSMVLFGWIGFKLQQRMN